MKKIMLSLVILSCTLFSFAELPDKSNNFTNRNANKITKDDNFVYFDNEKILGADPKTFELINFSYAKDKNHVYHYVFGSDLLNFSYSNSLSYNELSRRTWKLSNTNDQSWLIVYLADPETFQVHSEYPKYSFDKNYLYKGGLLIGKTDGNSLKVFNKDYIKTNDTVFYQGQILFNADAKTFEMLFSHATFAIAKDKNHVYFNNVIQKEIVDVPSFTILSGGDYAKDDVGVYEIISPNVYPTTDNKIRLDRNKNSASFEIIHEKKKITKDNNFVYTHGKKIEGANPNTFQLLSEKNDYVKDDSKIFWLDWRDASIVNADIDTFKVNEINPNWATDKNHVFFVGKIVENFSPENFVVLDKNYVKDDQFVYFSPSNRYLKKILLADTASFSVIDEEKHLSKDKKNVYFWENLIENSDPNTFQLFYGDHENTSFASSFAIDKNTAYFKKDTKIYYPFSNVDIETFIVDKYGSSAEDKNNKYSNRGNITPKIKKEVTKKQEANKSYNNDIKSRKACNHCKPKNKPQKWVVDHKCLADAFAYHGHLKENGPLCSERYKRDKTNLYYQNKIIENADPNSFVFINYLYFKDKDHAFYGKQLINESDAESFEALEYSVKYPEVARNNDPFSRSYAQLHIRSDEYTQVSKYSKDKNNIYFETLKVNHANPKNFTVLNDLFGKDDNNIFFENRMISNADIESFIVLEGKYSRDNNQLFFEDKKIADLRAFDNKESYQNEHYRHYDGDILLNREYKDRLKTYYRLPYINTGTKIFYDGESIENIDAKTFYPLRIFDQRSYKQRDLSSYYSRNKDHVYYKTKLVEGADPNSFIVTEEPYKNNALQKTAKGQDKFACYEEANKVECPR